MSSIAVPHAGPLIRLIQRSQETDLVPRKRHGAGTSSRARDVCEPRRAWISGSSKFISNGQKMYAEISY